MVVAWVCGAGVVSPEVRKGDENGGSPENEEREGGRLGVRSAVREKRVGGATFRRSCSGRRFSGHGSPVVFIGRGEEEGLAAVDSGDAGGREGDDWAAVFWFPATGEKKRGLAAVERKKPKIGLGVKSDGIVEPFQLRQQNNTFGIRYEPTLGKLHNMQSEKKVFMQEQVLVVGPEIVPEPDECIIEGIENLFIAMTEEDYGNNEVDLRMPTIHNAEPGEVLQNWTIHPSCFYMSLGSIKM
ncbi:hypothetical protein HAX54_025780 [Datura stramonium]|uniref:Uncharacterized protein n=1 Tax=Datura stramonium TaxID=4076 RepID=A0ABS8S791_DATST|nr:hypothetical protein [Datura stramonium]